MNILVCTILSCNEMTDLSRSFLLLYVIRARDAPTGMKICTFEDILIMLSKQSCSKQICKNKVKSFGMESMTEYIEYLVVHGRKYPYSPLPSVQNDLQCEIASISCE